MSYQRDRMYVNETKWISNGNQDMIANISYGIPKQSQGNRLRIKHKMQANELRFNNRHQHRIPVYTKNMLELYENERT